MTGWCHRLCSIQRLKFKVLIFGLLFAVERVISSAVEILSGVSASHKPTLQNKKSLILNRISYHIERVTLSPVEMLSRAMQEPLFLFVQLQIVRRKDQVIFFDTDYP